MTWFADVYSVFVLHVQKKYHGIFSWHGRVLKKLALVCSYTSTTCHISGTILSKVNNMKTLFLRLWACWLGPTFKGSKSILRIEDKVEQFALIYSSLWPACFVHLSKFISSSSAIDLLSFFFKPLLYCYHVISSLCKTLGRFFLSPYHFSLRIASSELGSIFQLLSIFITHSFYWCTLVN